MKFSYNWLKNLVKFKESPQELADFLTLNVFEVEDLKKVGSDWSLDIKFFPNRIADASGHLGLAREIAVLKGTALKYTPPQVRSNSQKKAGEALNVRIENSGDCLRYTAMVIDGVSIKSSPRWLKERIEVCGLQSVNNVVDAANYIMLETGQPLHVFDMQKLKGENEKIKTIVVRRAKKEERMLALDEKMYELNPEVLVIADKKEPIAIAGIKGGGTSGVGEKTTKIILESANFDPARVRFAAKSLNLRTDASFRFERGLDPNETEQAVKRLAALIREIAGGAVYKGVVDVYPKKVLPKKILFRPNYANSLIGEYLDRPFYKKVFSRMGWKFTLKNADFLIEMPTIRRDIAIEEDIVEEVARLFGYENVGAKMPAVALLPASQNDEVFWEEATRSYLSNIGFSESLLYEFTSEQELRDFWFNVADAPELANPTGPQTKFLVPRVLVKYVVSAAENMRDFPEVRIFGLVKSFRQSRNYAEQRGRIPRESVSLDEHKDLILVFGKKGVSGEDEFYELKGVVDDLLNSLGISDHWYSDAQGQRSNVKDQMFFHPYRFAEIKIGDEKIGNIGEIHPEILSNIKAKGRITAAEINFVKLAQKATSEAEYNPVSKFPAIVRDIALIVPLATKTEEITNLIENVGGELLEDSDLFDYFQDEAMHRADTKSLAFHLVFRSKTRTLKDEEVNKIFEKIVASLEEESWAVRK